MDKNILNGIIIAHLDGEFDNEYLIDYTLFPDYGVDPDTSKGKEYVEAVDKVLTVLEKI